jgi:hypothetical protein
VTNENKAKELGDELDRITDAHMRMRLQLQAAFGLRREESIKLCPGYADRGDHLVLKGSWTKGGRDRIVSITTPGQRDTLAGEFRLLDSGAQELYPATASLRRSMQGGGLAPRH